MATYEELRSLFSDDSLKNRMDVAVTVAAQTLLDSGSTTSQQRAWAAFVINDPRLEGEKAFRYILAKNKDLSLTQIQNASDNSLQNQVDSVVDQLVLAFNSQ